VKEVQDRIYTLEVGGRPVLAFPASNYREAQSIMKEEWLRADLRELKSEGAPLWNGTEKLTVRNAAPDEIERFAGEAQHDSNDELPVVYLVTAVR
jgi:hypothetical protein